jgi:hypothetical protein
LWLRAHDPPEPLGLRTKWWTDNALEYIIGRYFLNIFLPS